MNQVPVLEATNLKLQHDGGFSLDMPRLCVGHGEVLGIVGPNGAGKSTLLAALMGLVRLQQGTVIHSGRPLPSRPGREWRRGVSAVFQQPLLLDDTVTGNILTALAFKGIRGAVARTEADRWLAYFGIPDLGSRHTLGLSGGEAQRVSLARAFAGSPEIVFLDEPFSALDPPTRAALVGDLAGILRKTGTTALLVTHALDEMTMLCSRAVVLIAGRPTQWGTPEDVLCRPASPAVARFCGMENIYHGTVAGRLDNGNLCVHLEGIGDVSLPAGSCPVPVGGAVQAGFRPESARIMNGELTALPGLDLTGTVLRITPGASGYRLDVQGPLPLTVECDRFTFIRNELTIGSTVSFRVPQGAWHVISVEGCEPVSVFSLHAAGR